MVVSYSVNDGKSFGLTVSVQNQMRGEPGRSMPRLLPSSMKVVLQFWQQIYYTFFTYSIGHPPWISMASSTSSISRMVFFKDTITC
jgi:hypothetical protein